MGWRVKVGRCWVRKRVRRLVLEKKTRRSFSTRSRICEFAICAVCSAQYTGVYRLLSIV